MHTSAEQARAQLATAVARGPEDVAEAPSPLTDGGVRRSAVLMLFGVLDAVPADTARPRAVGRDLDVLLTRRADTMRHHPGQIAFPGGGAEPADASSAATALREAAEETGVDPSGVEILGALPDVHVPVSQNLVTPVVGWWRLPSAVEADHAESVEVMRVPVAELLDPAARGTAVLRRSARTYRGPAFALAPRFGGHVVWGLTGALLSGLFDELGWAEPWDAKREFALTA